VLLGHLLVELFDLSIICVPVVSLLCELDNLGHLSGPTEATSSLLEYSVLSLSDAVMCLPVLRVTIQYPLALIYYLVVMALGQLAKSDVQSARLIRSLGFGGVLELL